MDMGFEALGGNPASVAKSLETADLDKLATVFRRAETAGVRAWMLCALCVGLGLRRARYATHGAARLAKCFGCSERTVHRLAAIYENILQPRLESDAAHAKFPLPSATFYVVSIEAAAVVGKTPLVVLELAESEVRRDPRYTASKFRRQMLGASDAREPKIAKLLRGLAAARPADLERLAAMATTDNWPAILNAAAVRLDLARAQLAARVSA